MPMRFRKSMKVAPGVRLSLGGKSASLRVGGKHFGASVGTSGRKTVSGSLPGTGLGFVSHNGGGDRRPVAIETAPSGAGPAPGVQHQFPNGQPYEFVWTPRKVVGWIVAITALLLIARLFSSLHGAG